MNAEGDVLVLSERLGSVRFGVYVKPRASKTSLAGVREGQLVVAVAAPPVDGEANGELVRALGAWLGVRRRQVMIVAGQTGRAKVVDVEGLSADEVRRRLGVNG